MSLVTLDDMKTYLGISLGDVSQDDFLNSEIALFDQTVLNYCNNIFEQTTVTEVIYREDFDRAQSHYLYYYPIVSVTSVNEKAPNETDVSVTEHRVNKLDGKLTIQDTSYNTSWLFQNYTNGAYLEIIYEAGYATVPLEIQECVKALIQERYNKNNSGVSLNFGNNVQRINIPGVMGVDFDYTLNSNERKNKYGMLLGDYLNVFDSYCSERTLIGSNSEVYIS